MIQLTRLNNSSLVVNSDLIKFVEQAPDTVITLLNGEKILVRESAEQVMMKVVQFRQRVLGAAAVSLSSVSAQLSSGSDLAPKGHVER
jgi:flagellar protein FlbD